MQEILVPEAGESVTEADIVSWYKASGDYVEQDEALLELETDKASMEMMAEQSGILTISIEEGTVQVGDKLGFITPADKPEAASAPPKEEPKEVVEVAPKEEAPKVEKADHYAAGLASPAAKKQMDEKGLKPADIQASGKDGRITKQDVLSTPAPVASSQASEQSVKEEPSIKREKMSRLRKTIAKRLVEAKLTQAQLSTFNEVDMSGIMGLRKLYKEPFKEKYGVGLGFMSFFTKAVCLALKEYPVINAQVDGEETVYFNDCHIGIAVASPRGLVVPVIRHADKKSFSEIESDIIGFAMKAKEGSLSIEDMEGATFTITNGGTFGSMLSTPIVNYPQSAILGMHNIVERAVVVNKEIVVRPMMYVAVSYDHRIIDGSDSVRFLVAVKQRLEDPQRLLIEI